MLIWCHIQSINQFLIIGKHHIVSLPQHAL